MTDFYKEAATANTANPLEKDVLSKLAAIPDALETTTAPAISPGIADLSLRVTALEDRLAELEKTLTPAAATTTNKDSALEKRGLTFEQIFPPSKPTTSLTRGGRRHRQRKQKKTRRNRK